MGFPVFYDGKILFDGGKPAFSDACCCGGDPPNPCCGGLDCGCVWEDAPVSGLSWSGHEWDSTAQNFKEWEWSLTQSGASFTDSDPGECFSNARIPCDGYYKQRNGFGTVVQDVTLTGAIVEWGVGSGPKCTTTSLVITVLKFPIGFRNFVLTIDDSGSCEGSKSGSVSDTQISNSASFTANAAACPDV